jgi:uncharacterized integral membrane protein
MKTAKTGRNELCPCGSGKKYKQCHEGKAAEKSRTVGKWTAMIVGGLMLVGALVFFSSGSTSDPGSAPAGKVWSQEHGHYH